MRPRDTAWAEDQIQRYHDIRPRYEVMAEVLKRILDPIRDQHAPDGHVQVRAKDLESFAGKIWRKEEEDPVNDFTDLCGGRIITTTRDEVEKICGIIESSPLFEIDWTNSVDITQRLKPSEFGYRSVHYVVSLVKSDNLNRYASASEIELVTKDRLKAELQVRTSLEHSWSDFSHKLIYKKGIAIPDTWKREAAKLAAILEASDSIMINIKEGIRVYEHGFGPFRTPEALAVKIENLGKTLAIRPGNMTVLEELSGLLVLRGDFAEVIRLLGGSPVLESSPVLLRNYGISLLKTSRPGSPEFTSARISLEKASSKDSIATVYLAESCRDLGRDDKAHALLLSAYENDPLDGSIITHYLVTEVNCAHSTAVLRTGIPDIRRAISRCRDIADAGAQLPLVFYQMGLLHLLAGEPYPALHAFAKAISLSPSNWITRDSFTVLQRLATFQRDIRGYFWSERLLLLALANTGDFSARKEVKKRVMRQYVPAEPVIILSGGCDARVQEQLDSYRHTLIFGFTRFHGTVISGGTRAGIAGIAGDIGLAFPGQVNTIGYLPSRLPPTDPADTRYTLKPVITDETEGFTPLQPLQNWTDLIGSGIAPGDVTLIGINGGRIAATEFRIALALGARVGIIDGSGRSASQLLADPDWSDHPGLIVLPPDRETIRAFVALQPSGFDQRDLVMLGKEIHRKYQSDRLGSCLKGCRELNPALADWEDLDPGLRQSNIAQADHILEKLTRMGYEVRKIQGSRSICEFSDRDEVLAMAEMEHGRFNAERLKAGWRYGPIDSTDHKNKISPYLIPFSKLSDEVKGWDCDFVNEIPELLAKIGYEIVPPKRETKTP